MVDLASTLCTGNVLTVDSITFCHSFPEDKPIKCRSIAVSIKITLTDVIDKEARLLSCIFKSNELNKKTVLQLQSVSYLDKHLLDTLKCFYDPSAVTS